MNIPQRLNAAGQTIPPSSSAADKEALGKAFFKLQLILFEMLGIQRFSLHPKGSRPKTIKSALAHMEKHNPELYQDLAENRIRPGGREALIEIVTGNRDKAVLASYLMEDTEPGRTSFVRNCNATPVTCQPTTD